MQDICYVFSQSLVEEHLGCFQFLVIMNKTATNIYVKLLCEQVFISLGWLYKTGIAGSFCTILYSPPLPIPSNVWKFQ